jgi:YD repeat-containing protein
MLGLETVKSEAVWRHDGTPVSLCGSTQQASSYDANGNPTRQIAHDGSVTFIAYDSKGRETERASFAASYNTAPTRPALANATRVVSTKWHATFNLPTQVAEPNKTTANTYSSKGLLTGQSWTATTDATGAAKFTAVKTGSTYATGWSYSASSRITLQRDKVESFDRYPFCLPAIRALEQIDLHPKVTFFVGENGSGKSTLLEALAVSLGFNAEGGSKNFRFGTRQSHSELHEYLRVAKESSARATASFCARRASSMSPQRSSGWTKTAALESALPAPTAGALCTSNCTASLFSHSSPSAFEARACTSSTSPRRRYRRSVSWWCCRAFTT